MPADPHAARNADLRRWRSAFPDATSIADLVLRTRSTCVGVVHLIRLVPAHSLEVTVTDGSGRLTAVWPGRTRLPGVELGGALRLTGTVGRRSDGTKVMRSPEWVVLPDPYG